MKKFLIAALVAQILFSGAAEAVKIVDKPIKWTAHRESLIREYALEHYGFEATEIEPRAVVVHWTAFGSCDSTYKYFYAEEFTSGIDAGTLNVASHFLVDRDGTIYRLTSETALNRHAIGYNWCAIGIENVGGVNGAEDLTVAQLQANVELIKYLHEKYPAIEYVFGHYQQNEAKESGLFIELVPDYYAGKSDPGKIFMRHLRDYLEGDGLKFFQP